ncbi:AB hydrolase superfamily protein B1A11.02 [Lachnellula arida]|uniref:AB hydrolase superfamily protein B1A11.02 n=1 Tax=Lachnellula arida TaxID=1316785 RepID=A0A8T9B4Q8_9HELO|nr:AB hydrolase superfamily protein B1A11.02 [Lachnellula arida]
MTPEEHLALANINPELEEILKNSPPVPPLDPNLDIPTLRATLLAQKRKLTESQSTGEVTYIEEDRQIPVRDGASIAVRIHKPKVLPKDGSPVFVVYHGGGFVLGGLDSEVLLCRKFTELGGIAINVDYRMAPENPFPTPINDAYDALKWTAANFEELGGDPKKGFLVGGISAGANFGAVVSHLYRDDDLWPPLTGAYLSIPPCIAPELVPAKYKDVYLSREQNKDAPRLNKERMDFFHKMYNADPNSPLTAPSLFETHRGLPPTYFQICGLDPLRDEAIIYEDILKEQGVKTKVDFYPGLPHAFWSAWLEAGFSKGYQEDCVKALKWLLEQS